MAEKMNGLSREFIIHPGETLKEMLQDRDMKQRELAMRTDVKEPHISGIVNCQKPISVSFAKKLEYALGVDASFWINLQANYEKELADFEEINQISSEELAILQKLKSITEYAQDIRLLNPDAQGSMLVIEWRKRLNVSSLSRIPEISQAGAYRLAVTDNVDPYILFTWLRICDLITNNQQLNQELNINKLKKKLPLIRKLTFEEDVETIRLKLKDYFAECGIKFTIVKHFTGAPVQGVIKRNNDGSLSLIMTVRYKFADVFWFTLFHEIGHILNEDIEDKLIDYEFTKNEAENRADEFAANVLINSDRYNSFVESGDFSLMHISQFCAEQNIPSFILIGRLQKDEHLKYHDYSREKIRYELDEAERVMQ
ncbi:HigA family addiction module antitoxin [Metallumcola ferriviriculae]|uniref:HigA family addiction module antitoxin n=1 Tax=Metallumcola ferriviriculae TaxID=3039180 RepID=A0AAU0USX8_9FIRM|nr:HigA family addiction module antitoxin [Desulfitibacteraceae bacterium MK1]